MNEFLEDVKTSNNIFGLQYFENEQLKPHEATL